MPSSPYMPIPQQPATAANYSFRSIPFNVAFTTPASVSNGTGSSTATAPQYKPPAHKHAHHLHSIPPREKSTRTLIIDHMLWAHGRTRFAQARAELGMTDRTGGPSSSNYSHRHRPENYEEDDEVGSEGEDANCLKARSDVQDQLNDTDNERLGRQDLPLAQNLRLRAEGLEKVVTSMLDQPPPVHPVVDDDVIAPPGSSPGLKLIQPSEIHKLPNGVRLRLALGTIINDLFARQSPRTVYRHTHQCGSKAATPTSQTSLDPSGPGLPAALTPLSSVSAAKTLFTPQVSPISQIYPARRFPPSPNQRTVSLYSTGADLTAGNTPAGYRCPRHLHTQCEICVEAKMNAGIGRSSGGTTANLGGSNSTRTASGSLPGPNSGFKGNIPSAGWKGTPAGSGPCGGGVSGWQDGVGIGAGLLTPGAIGCALRRKTRDWDAVLAGIDVHGHSGAGNTKLTSLIPRFLRISALVAAELGREAKDEEQEREAKLTDLRGRQTNETNGGVSVDETSEAGSSQESRIYEIAFRPTREWYMLLAGLLTRAVLEGYLTAEWRGVEAVECLLTVGLGVEDQVAKILAQDNEEMEEVKYEQFDPDDMPGLTDAIKLLFPSLRETTPSRKAVSEEEYEAEMFERLRRFYDVRQLAPDLMTHLEDLAWQYPAEPIERAALRFCEALTKWRGKPELQTYKKKPAPSTPSLSSMSIESLVHSNPTSPTNHHTMGPIQNVPGSIPFPVPVVPRRTRRKPSIDFYFAPSSFLASPWRQTPGKRLRSLSTQLQASPAKRLQT
ncbi:hypothetical protein M378DRAFT_16745 [Amanita muscaria Koide BX008]|uniref:Uncharacterized protein n=1 Tax=Amanita muscaria (strain Koide BX008) TaxID=946122 RepID=A0A0C2WJH1_AMAMK|nr:hypothetical protein M378DRAFT_16745 [Amanita muscaria Koide BX008]